MAEAYCGPAPTPETLLTAWNADVVALCLFGGLMLAHLRLHGGESGRAGRRPLAAALAVLLALFLSPLCALTVALFSARVAHHVLLVAVAAPLLALAFPRSAPQLADSRQHLPLPLLVAAHTLVVWLWHAPPAYQFAISGAAPYWTMQASLLATAMLMWQRILSPQTGTGPALLALLATATQMGMLGALLVFAREPLYAPHFATTLAYGLTPLADQQLGGLVMWVPAALPYLAAAALLSFTRFERAAGQAARR